jgi:hypothetical protein
MEYRQLGRSGLRVSALTLGTMTFGGGGFFAKTGSTDVAGARRMIDIAVEAGVNLLDTADVYSKGRSEEIIGEALGDKRNGVLIATKARFTMGEGPNDSGVSRWHLIRACEASLRRLRTDHIDIYFMHEWDGLTPLEETLEALDSLVRSGKVRYLGCSNYSAWHLMKALGLSERMGLQRFVHPADPLHAAGAGSGIRAGPDRARSRRRHPGLEPDRRRAAFGQVPPRRAGPGRHPAFSELERAAGARRGKLFDIVEVLVEIGEARGVSAAQGGAGVAARPARRIVPGDRRPNGGAAARQSRRRRTPAERG